MIRERPGRLTPAGPFNVLSVCVQEEDVQQSGGERAYDARAVRRTTAAATMGADAGVTLAALAAA